MTRVTWGDVGQRFYEAGADRGMLYLPGIDGVAWNGLTAVRENPTGGDPQPYYIDGFKYQNVASAEEFEATIDAFSSPREFDVCDGTQSIHNGLFITQQRRQPFNLSYRTMVGNDVDGAEHGYKIHLVYNALAAPSTRDNRTLGESPDPVPFSWAVTTMPPRLTGYKPSAHLFIDSRSTSPEALTALEDLLYGTEFSAPEMPEQADLIALFAV